MRLGSRKFFVSMTWVCCTGLAYATYCPSISTFQCKCQSTGRQHHHQNARTPDPLDWVISSSNTTQKRSHSSPPQKASAPPPTPALLPDASSTPPHIYFGSLPSIAV